MRDKAWAWPAISGALMDSPDARVGSQATALALVFGDPAALAKLVRLAAADSIDKVIEVLITRGLVCLVPLRQGDQ